MFAKRYAVISVCAMAALAMSCGPSDSGKTKTEQAAAKAAPAAKTNAPAAEAKAPAAEAKAPAAAIDPCALLTKEEARKILGAAVKDGKRQDVGTFAPGTSCQYLTSAPIEEAGGTWGVTVEVYDQATFDKRTSYFKSPAMAFHRNHKAMKLDANSHLVDIKDVGDEAYWTGGHLYVLDRGVELVFTVHAKFHIPPGPGEKVDAEEDAAELHASTDLAKNIVLPRLEKM